MIPHSSAGHSWAYPMRDPNGGPGRLDLAQAAGHFDSPSIAAQQTAGLMQSQPAARPTPTIEAGSTGSHDRAPPLKRPRLDLSGTSNLSDGGSAMSSTEPRSTPTGTGSRPQLSWRGRPAWSFQSVISEIPGHDARGDNASGSKPSSPPPFPAQPWTSTTSVRLPETDSGLCDPPPVKKVSTTPYRIETPSTAPILKGDKVAGFAPWTGNHPEDILNEQTAKSGYYDRTQVSQNESNTARPALYAQLKHRTGLQMLSTVFTAALEKRQNHSTVHAPSTFKPPPRVTLTDNKREAWLRDLANSAVPLRRLSRTIPHGIRGKVLLDQCLGKWIPIARALWLAKCVGANEIRAFKRKGTSGALATGLEVKWVREWTTNVQQFVEGVLTAPKSTDWKTKMTYAVGLCARLFYENLLDHEQFLDWFLASFEAAPLATVPIWLLMLGIYWDNIMRFRRRARRLAEILLEKLRQTTAAEVDALRPLLDRLSRFVRKIVHEHTSSMILPNAWPVYNNHVRQCLDLSKKADCALLRTVATRNLRVQRPQSSQLSTQPSSHQRVIHLFDSVHTAHDVLAASAACLDALDDGVALVSKLLEWLATPFRHGISRVYVGVRLLRRWKACGVDVDQHILTFLATTGTSKNLNLENVYHTISELVRSQTFSVGRYLQWLMAKGASSRQLDDNVPSISRMAGDIELITQLPTCRLPEHVGNLRKTLMARTGYSTAEEVQIIDEIKTSITLRLPELFDSTLANASLPSLPTSRSWAVKAEVTQWLRRSVVDYTRTSSLVQQTSLPTFSSEICALTPEEFSTVRGVLEEFGDISILADVLNVASSSDNAIVLASIADTINFHYDALSVIGATTDLFRKLVGAYSIIKRNNVPSLDVIFSLIELSLRMPNEGHIVAILRQDLSRLENRSVVAACSPISDHIPDTLADADPLLREKLDQLLHLGSVIDEPTMDAVFRSLTKHLEGGDDNSSLSMNDTCRYMVQLRSFHPKHFDVTLARWVCMHMKSPDRSNLMRILPSLIGVGCVTIRSFWCLATRLSASPNSIPNAAILPAELIKLLMTGDQDTLSLDLVSYRFNMARQQFISDNTDTILSTIHDAAAYLNGIDGALIAKFDNLENTMVRLLVELLTRKPVHSSHYCSDRIQSQPATFSSVVRGALDILLGTETMNGPHTVIAEVENLALGADEFSLPLCRLKLRMIFQAQTNLENRSKLVDAMFRTVVAGAGAHKSKWTDLVALMSSDSVRQIRERAEKEFLAIPLLEEPVISEGTGNLNAAKLHLSIIEQLAYSIPESGVPTIAPLIIEKLESLLQRMVMVQNSQPENHRAPGTDDEYRDMHRTLIFWCLALLRLVVLHRTSFTQAPVTAKTGFLQEQSRLLVLIFSIALSRLSNINLSDNLSGAEPSRIPAVHDESQSCSDVPLQTHALDLAAILIDVFPDEARHQCARILKEKCPPFAPLLTDQRFVYLLGPSSDLNVSAALQSTSVQSPMGSASTPTPLPPNATTVREATQSALPTSTNAGPSENPGWVINQLRYEHRGRIIGPYPIRPWELLEDAAPFVGINDTAVNLGYFDARRVRV
ncbi:Uncharacterized protein PECH_007546 [Penicillium ucsense]|uniref:Mediator of RNA polymerase II transcription subunit 12 n=1 Tax=Penicillium ucsense TaxID=2839758 RepID=A0A8J8W5I7_9EURO|nr:Uncharacterized protein PECM_004442 [Penicillium ucsense]KAF7738844.1 Uncharacterized protein PECH_007546 [Penicillium ucsense]